MRTLIALPCMDSVATPFFNSFIHLRMKGEAAALIYQGTLIYEARNKMAMTAVRDGFDYVLWLDSDMIFEPDTLERMLDSIGDNDLLSGLYFTRKEPIKPCIFKTCSTEVKDGLVIPDCKPYLDYPKNSKFQIAGCGFGTVLTKVSMLKGLIEKTGMPFAPVYGFGEDLAFCLRANQLGYKLACDSSIKTGHVMHIISNEDLFLREGIKNG